MAAAAQGAWLVLASLPLGWAGHWAVRALAGRERAPPASLPIALNVLAGVWTYAVAPAGWPQAASLALAWTLTALACVDAAILRLPNLLTIPLAGVGLLLGLAGGLDGLADHAAGAAVGYLVLAAVEWAYRRVRGRAGLGLGDAKLAAAAGAWLGWRAIPSVILIGCVFGLAWAAARAALRRGSLQEPLPFGAPLCAATWIVWLYGPLTFAG